MEIMSVERLPDDKLLVVVERWRMRYLGLREEELVLKRESSNRVFQTNLSSGCGSWENQRLWEQAEAWLSVHGDPEIVETVQLLREQLRSARDDLCNSKGDVAKLRERAREREMEREHLISEQQRLKAALTEAEKVIAELRKLAATQVQLPAQKPVPALDALKPEPARPDHVWKFHSGERTADALRRLSENTEEILQRVERLEYRI